MTETDPPQGERVDAQKPRGSRIMQGDVPGRTLADALRIPLALRDNFASSGARPVQLASAINMQPASGPFRTLTGAAEAYGLTIGASRSESIELTALGRKIVSPTEEGADLIGRREAVMRPRVIREFLEKYDGQRVPRADIAANVITEEMGIPRDAAERALEMILANGDDVGIIVENKGNRYVDLKAPIATGGPPATLDVYEGTADGDSNSGSLSEDLATGGDSPSAGEQAKSGPAGGDGRGSKSSRRLFISHGKDKKIVDQLKTILRFGDFDPVVAVEEDSVAIPVPDKIIGSMRECGGAIIHVSTEVTLSDKDGTEVPQVNPNVLVEIGAAMALYGRRFILLVEQGTTLPSNLQGLYEVRYTGSELDHDSTMRLLSLLADFRQ